MSNSPIGFPGRLHCEIQAAGHHPEILVAIRAGKQQTVIPNRFETGLLQQRRDAVTRVESLGVELVCDHASLCVNHDFS